MKFNCSVEIDLPVDQVTTLWSNPENLKHWQDGFVSMDQISGEPGEPGSKSKMIYGSGKRKIELVETIKTNDLPREFSGKYEAKEMVNLMTNRFQALGENQTRWEAEIEYIQFNGFMPKLMATLMPGMFRKQTQKWLDQFKQFAEQPAQST